MSRPKGSRLTPIRFLYRNEASHSYWLYKCDCGNEKKVRESHYKHGEIRSCGCLLKEAQQSFPDRITPEMRKKAGDKTRGRPSPNRGKIMIYEFQNAPRRMKGRKKYVTEEELNDIWRGDKEIVWD